MPFKKFKEASRNDSWGVTLSDNDNLTIDQIQLGAILRIADASEAMAKNNNNLLDDVRRPGR